MLMLSLIPSIICFLSIDIVADTGSKPSKACSTVCLLVNSLIRVLVGRGGGGGGGAYFLHVTGNMGFDWLSIYYDGIQICIQRLPCTA